MRITVQIGSELLRIPCEPFRTVSWLQAEVIRRYELLHKGTFPSLSHLRTLADNIVLYGEDQLIEVCHEDERLCAVLQSTHETLEPQAGDMLAGSYYLVALCGQGATGRVFRARDLNLNREVAVKVLKTEKMNEINTRRFLREAELNATLSYCPHIVSVYDAGRTRTGILYMVMELLRGTMLSSEMEHRVAVQRPFTALQVIHIIQCVLLALHAAHTHKPTIIHRDVKPENVFVDPSPQLPLSNASNANSTSAASAATSSSHSQHYCAQLTDFGIAVHSDMRHQTLACGTRMFASPEQMRRVVQLTPASDLWAVCVCMWSMLTLQFDVPFDPIDLVLAKAQHAPSLVPHLVSDASPELCDIVMRGLNVAVAERWQSAQQMLDALHDEEQRILARQQQQHSPTILRPPTLATAASADQPEDEMMTCTMCKGVGLVPKPRVRPNARTSTSKL